ncbi:MAG: M23 family metallopeptidase [Methylocystis sp.]|nr:M23 family metallopeptidase [Methylocystis sp.]MCA3588284.1 M23 family metallopeptidase [Methylocystis sp.]MCA3590202.1 M23 family metallopeptidase [Methylocystis sp.]
MPFSRRDRTPGMVDLGDEPPLDAGGRKHAMDDRRKVSSRWLAATVLTGLSGAGLMAGAVVGVHDSIRNVASRPQLASSQRPLAAQAERPLVTARKGDKLVRSIDLTTAKQTFKTPTTIRAGDREVIKVKSFARLSAPLLLVGGAYQDEIPLFNPLKMLTDGADRAFEATPAQAADDPDAEVSLVSLDLAGSNAPFAASTLSDMEVRAQVRETGAVPRLQVSAIAPQMLLARTMRAPALPGGAISFAPANSPFSRLEVRMIEENVTVVPKTEALAVQEALDEKVAIAVRGQTIEQIVRANGGTQAQGRAISAALKDKSLTDGQRIRFLFAAPEPGAPRQLVRMTIYGDDQIEGIAAMNDMGVFVSVAPPAAVTAGDEEEEDEGSRGLALYNSLYETALKNDIPRAIVDDLIRIVSADSDTDFQRPVTGGDALDLFYAEEEDGDGREILYVALTAGGETKRYYRFTNPDDTTVDYFDENGRSAKKFLMRKPIVEGQLRSGFGMRRHPVLGYSKMHTGIDYSNRIGTPIIAAGNGTVISAGWDAGYGRRIEIQHANGYVTTYSHMSRFARNVQAGSRVRQGTVIGYLGNTGLSTGPHLHYEVIVNDRYVDPLRIRIPRGRELDGRILAEFRRERERIDGLRMKAPTATTRAAALAVR